MLTVQTCSSRGRAARSHLIHRQNPSRWIRQPGDWALWNLLERRDIPNGWLQGIWSIYVRWFMINDSLPVYFFCVLTQQYCHGSQNALDRLKDIFWLCVVLPWVLVVSLRSPSCSEYDIEFKAAKKRFHHSLMRTFGRWYIEYIGSLWLHESKRSNVCPSMDPNASANTHGPHGYLFAKPRPLILRLVEVKHRLQPSTCLSHQGTETFWTNRLW